MIEPRVLLAAYHFTYYYYHLRCDRDSLILETPPPYKAKPKLLSIITVKKAGSIFVIIQICLQHIRSFILFSEVKKQRTDGGIVQSYLTFGENRSLSNS